jgi:hypothetical protein
MRWKSRVRKNGSTVIRLFEQCEGEIYLRKGKEAFLGVSGVVIEEKFIGMGSQPDGIDLALPFVPHPGLQYVHGEDIPFHEELMIPFQGLQDLIQGS